MAVGGGAREPHGLQALRPARRQVLHHRQVPLRRGLRQRRRRAPPKFTPVFMKKLYHLQVTFHGSPVQRVGPVVLLGLLLVGRVVGAAVVPVEPLHRAQAVPAGGEVDGVAGVHVAAQVPVHPLQHAQVVVLRRVHRRVVAAALAPVQVQPLEDLQVPVQRGVVHGVVGAAVPVEVEPPDQVQVPVARGVVHCIQATSFIAVFV
mmetsp:Transcript_27565/g.41081  ORF Transcript_27565/g.41081 Transcript_27565/m.41081 type:complete len:204 (+) Transcript_27565:859-1470(+)